MITKQFRFLLLRGEEEQARKSIIFYHGCKIGAIDQTLRGIKDTITSAAKAASIKEVFKDKHLRKGTLLGVVISFTTCFSGTTGW